MDNEEKPKTKRIRRWLLFLGLPIILAPIVIILAGVCWEFVRPLGSMEEFRPSPEWRATGGEPHEGTRSARTDTVSRDDAGTTRTLPHSTEHVFPTRTVAANASATSATQWMASPECAEEYSRILKEIRAYQPRGASYEEERALLRSGLSHEENEFERKCGGRGPYGHPPNPESDVLARQILNIDYDMLWRWGRWEQLVELYRQKDWDRELFCYRQMGSSGAGLIVSRTLQRYYKAVDRSFPPWPLGKTLPFVTQSD